MTILCVWYAWKFLTYSIQTKMHFADGYRWSKIILSLKCPPSAGRPEQMGWAPSHQTPITSIANVMLMVPMVVVLERSLLNPCVGKVTRAVRHPWIIRYHQSAVPKEVQIGCVVPWDDWNKWPYRLSIWRLVKMVDQWVLLHVYHLWQRLEVSTSIIIIKVIKW